MCQGDVCDSVSSTNNFSGITFSYIDKSWINSNLNIKKLHKKAKIPEQMVEGDAGFDLYTLHNHNLKYEDGVVLIPTGIAIEVPQGYEAEIRPRSSSFAKKGLHIHHGTIDSGYRGEIKVGVSLLRPGKRWIEHHERIAQLCIRYIPQFELNEVDELSDSERGKDGYGSTG